MDITGKKTLEATKTDWAMILDGDEVWWDEEIKKCLKLINEKKDTLDSIVSRYYNLVGDIFHYELEQFGNHQIDGKRGHLTIRFMNMTIPGLYTSKYHGQHGYFDGDNIPIQERSSKRRFHINPMAYLHFTHLIRFSSLAEDKKVPKRSWKYKYELGKNLPLEFFYPEAFFRDRPGIIQNPWVHRSDAYIAKSLAITHLRKIKQYISKDHKSGY